MKCIEIEIHAFIRAGNRFFAAVQAEIRLVEVFLRSPAAQRFPDLAQAVESLRDHVRAVLDHARDSEEVRRVFAGAEAHHTLQSVLGLGAKPDPGDFRSDSFEMLNDAEHAAEARKADQRIVGLYRRSPARGNLTACLRYDDFIRRVLSDAARKSHHPLELQAALKKLVSYVVAFSDHLQGRFRDPAAPHDQQPPAAVAMDALFRAVRGGGRPRGIGDEGFVADAPDEDGDIAGLETEVLQQAPHAGDGFGVLRALRAVVNFVNYHATRVVPLSAADLAVTARSFLVRVTSGFSAPCRLKAADLDVFTLLGREKEWYSVILCFVESFAIRACDREALLLFARDRGDLEDEPVALTGVGADVLDLIWAISPPGLPEPLAALYLIRTGLFVASDPAVLDSSRAIAGQEVGTYLPREKLTELEGKAMRGVVSVFGASALALHSGEISNHHPALDALLEWSGGADRALLRNNCSTPVMGRVIRAVCQTLPFDLNMAYHKATFFEVIRPVEERVALSGREAGPKPLALGDETLAQSEVMARGCSFSSVSPHGRFNNSTGAKGQRAPGNEETRRPAVNAAVEAVLQPPREEEGGRGLPPAFVAIGEAVVRPDVPPSYGRRVYLAVGGHTAGAKGTFVSFFFVCFSSWNGGERFFCCCCCFWFFFLEKKPGKKTKKNTYSFFFRLLGPRHLFKLQN